LQEYYRGKGEWGQAEAGLDITGTESYVAGAARGLTLGGWFWQDAAASFAVYTGKAGGTYAYLLYNPGPLSPGDNVRFQITDTTPTSYSVDGSLGGFNKWVWLVGRFTPSTELKLWCNLTTWTNTSGIPASIRTTTAGYDVGNSLVGRASCCFVCAAALSDAILSSLYQQTRGAFGV
jgi:hypothetical protein